MGCHEQFTTPVPDWINLTNSGRWWSHRLENEHRENRTTMRGRVLACEYDEAEAGWGAIRNGGGPQR
jgi:hypothetical protein